MPSRLQMFMSNSKPQRIRRHRQSLTKTADLPMIYDDESDNELVEELSSGMGNWSSFGDGSDGGLNAEENETTLPAMDRNNNSTSVNDVGVLD